MAAPPTGTHASRTRPPNPPLPIDPTMSRLAALTCSLSLALGTLCLPAFARADAFADRALTTSGPVIGASRDGVTAFLGIPYAAPPTGALRFRPPQPAAPWRAPRQALSFGPACPQTAALGTPSTDEDCLSLNVYRPAGLQQPGRPLLVFFYGGSFRYGDAGTAPGGHGPDYRGDQLARRTGAIVVTVNYRLGALGFLAAPALDQENPAHVSGNYGLLDQQAALRWVQANARAFGGDPRKVTVFGQSAGAVSILDQLVSPGAAGLFAGAELESAGALAVASLATAERRDRDIVAAVGCTQAGDVAACLRAAPVASLLAAGGSVGPNVDGQVLPLAPEQAFAKGAFAHVPVIEGSNLDEGTYFIAGEAAALGHALSLGEAERRLKDAFGDTAASEIAAHYALAASASPGQALAGILTDEFFSCPAYRLRASLETQVPVAEYEFSQPHPVLDYPVPTAPGIDDGDAHTSELAYVFGHDGAGRPLAGADALLSDRMLDALGLFAWSGQAGWPFIAAPAAGSDAAAPVLSLGTPIRLSHDFYQRHQCGFWAGLGNPTALF